MRGLSLSKDKARLLASRSKERNLLQSDVMVSHLRIWEHVLETFFRVDGPMVFCHDINGLSKGLKQEHNPTDWRFSIDSSQRSPQAVLLHKGKSKTSIHCAHLKESYDNTKLLLEAIQDNIHHWNIYGDLKVIGILMGTQGGPTKLLPLFMPLGQSLYRRTLHHP
jgi:hypothetical protein